MSAIVSALAASLERQSTTVTELIAKKLFEGTADRLLSALDQAGLHPLSALRTDSRPSQSAGWQPALGIAAAALRSGNENLSALQLISIAQPKAAFELTVRLDRPGALYLDGHLFHVADQVTVIATSNEMCITSQGGVARMDAVLGCWLAEGNQPEVRPVHQLSEGIARYVIVSGIKGSSSVFPDPFKRTPPADDVSELVQRDLCQIGAALGTLATSARHQREWLAASIDGLLLVSGPGAALSSPEFPGLLALASGRSVVDYIEALASGACHQKLFQLALVAALTRPGREEVHYVPARRSYTTTRRALAAAHEHVNVVETLRGLVGTGLPYDVQLLERVERRRLMLAVDCVPALSSSAILTDAGMTLWHRLRDVSEDGGLQAAAELSPRRKSVAAECGV